MTSPDLRFAGASRAILFDLDGTLVDTAPDMVAVLHELQLARGLEPVPYALARNSVSNGALGLVRLGFDPNIRWCGRACPAANRGTSDRGNSSRAPRPVSTECALHRA